MSEEQNKNINLGAPVIEEGTPQFAGRGPTKSKYDAYISAAKGLGAGQSVRVAVGEGTTQLEAINALRTALRRAGPKGTFKVRRLADGDLAILKGTPK